VKLASLLSFVALSFISQPSVLAQESAPLVPAWFKKLDRNRDGAISGGDAEAVCEDRRRQERRGNPRGSDRLFRPEPGAAIEIEIEIAIAIAIAITIEFASVPCGHRLLRRTSALSW